MWPSQSRQPQPSSYGINSLPEPRRPQLGGGIPNGYNGRPTLPESSYPVPSRVPESLWMTEDAYRPAITPDPRYPAGYGHAPLPLVPISTVPVSPGHFLGGQLGLPQPPHFSKDPHQSLPTRNSHPNPRIPRQPAPPGYQPSSHRFEPHRPLRRTNSHPSDGSFDNDDHEGTPPGQLPWMPQSSGWSMQHFGGYVDQQATHSNPTYPSQSNSNTFYRRTTHAPVPSMVSFRCKSPDDGDVYNRSLSTNNSRTNTITSQHPTPSSYQTYNHQEPFRPVTLRTTNLPPRGRNADAHNRNVTPNSELHSTAQGRASGPPPKSSVTSGSSSQCQDSTQVPGVSSVPSDPQSGSLPSSSQPSSQLGLTRAPCDHIHTTLATRLNEKQARELPGKVDIGDTSRGMAPLDERCDAGPSVAPSGVPTSKSSKHAVTSSASSRRRQKSAQGPRPDSPSLDPSPTSKPSRLNEPQKLPGEIPPQLPDSGDESRGIVPCNEQRDAGLPKSAAPNRASGPRLPEQTVTSSESPFVATEAPCLSSPSLNLLPTSTPSRPNELREPSSRVLPELSDSGVKSRGMVPFDEQRDAGPSEPAAQSRLSGSSKQTITSSAFSFTCQKTTDAPCLSSPSLDPLPTSTPSRPNEPPDRVLPELSDSGNETRGIGHYDEQHDASPSTAPASPKHFVTSSNPSSMHQESAQATRLSSPRLNPPPVTAPSSSQSPPPPTLMLASSHQISGTRAALLNEPRESSGKVLPELPCSGNESREIASSDERRDAGPSVSPRRDSGSQEYPTASKSPPLRQKPTQAPPFAAFASPDLGPPLASTSSLQIPSRVASMGAPSHLVRATRVVLPNGPKEPPDRVLPVLPYPGDENRGVTDPDEQHYGSLSNYIADFAESEPQGGSTNGVMWEMLRFVLLS